MTDELILKSVAYLEKYGREREYVYSKKETLNEIILEYEFDMPRFSNAFKKENINKRIPATLKAQFEKDDGTAYMTIYSSEMEMSDYILMENIAKVTPKWNPKCFILSESGDTFGFQISLNSIKEDGMDCLMDILFYICCICESYFYERYINGLI